MRNCNYTRILWKGVSNNILKSITVHKIMNYLHDFTRPIGRNNPQFTDRSGVEALPCVYQ